MTAPTPSSDADGTQPPPSRAVDAAGGARDIAADAPPTRVIDALRPHVTDRRLARMRDVLGERTRSIVVVLEEVYQPHNASAVLRSCDAFGVQDVWVVEGRNEYRPNPEIELGTSKWLTIRRVATIREAVERLRATGYRIVATTPHRDEVTPATLPLDAAPIALLFGTEMEGLTPEALEMADTFLRIPMVGFVESLNISVSAAVSLSILTTRLRAELPRATWAIGEEARDEILAEWMRASVGAADLILARSGII